MEQNQAYLFYVFLLTGVLIGILFDVFRILRKSFKTSDFATTIQDILFWLLTSILVLYTIFKFNDGEIRSYVFLGIGIGISVYIILFSKIVITVNVKIIKALKRIVVTLLSIMLYPIKFILKYIRKHIFNPMCFVIVNMKKMTIYKINNIKKRGKVKK